MLLATNITATQGKEMVAVFKVSGRVGWSVGGSGSRSPGQLYSPSGRLWSQWHAGTRGDDLWAHMYMYGGGGDCDSHTELAAGCCCEGVL